MKSALELEFLDVMSIYINEPYIVQQSVIGAVKAQEELQAYKRFKALENLVPWTTKMVTMNHTSHRIHT